MNPLLRNMALALSVWLSLSGACFGKQLYLRDGGIVECKSFRQQGNVVYVLVNRDTEVWLDLNRVDLKRTFHHHGKKSHHVHKIMSRRTAQSR